MNSNLLVRTGIYGLLALIAAAACSAGAAYLLRYSTIPVALVSLGMCAYAVYAARVALKPVMLDVHSLSIRKYLLAGLTFIVLLAPIYMLCQLILFLATTWDVHWKMHSGLLAALRFPDALVQGIVNFVGAVWDAFVGDPPAPPRRGRVPDPSPSVTSALLGWAAISIREIVVGVVSTILAAIMMRRMNRSV